jgi:predicted CoA-binding protein
MFANPDKWEIDAFLRRIRHVAILGLSEKPGRPSHNVAKSTAEF